MVRPETAPTIGTLTGSIQTGGEDHNRYEEMGSATVDQRREDFERKRRATSERQPR